MKTTFKYIFPTFFFLIGILSLSSCHKDNPPTPAPAMGLVYFHLHTNIDTTEADSGVVCHDATGRHFQLNIAQLYLSNIVLHKPDNTTYTVTGAYVLKIIANEEYLVGQAPAGNYTSVSFNVGIDAATNAMNPSMMTGCLAPQTPSMWFGSIAQGYMFANVQGVADTTAAQAGPVNCAFSYQLGTSAMLETVNLPSQPFTVVSGQTALVHIICDYGRMLQGIDFKTQSMATPFSNAGVAAQIAANVPFMFHYE